MHDPRVGRFFAPDPLFTKYPWYSPYQFSGNRVIDMVELEGLEPASTKDRENPPTGMATDINTGELTEITPLKEVFITNRTGAKIMNAVKDIAVSVLTPVAKTSRAIGGAITGASSISDELNANYNAAYAPSTDPYAAAMVCALPVLAVAVEVGAISYVVYEGGSLLASEAAGYRALFSGSKWVMGGKMLYGSTSNAFSQYFANGKWGDVNMMESGFSALPGYGATVLGEGLNFTYNNWKKKGQGITYDFTSKQALLSIGGGIFSNYFGDKTDDYLDGEKGGVFVGEFFKFQVETATNINLDKVLNK